MKNKDKSNKKQNSAEAKDQESNAKPNAEQNGPANDEKEKNKKQIERQINFMIVFGEVCWLLSNSKAHRYNCFLADIEWLVMPPVTAGQFKVFHANNQPIGLALWAYVSDEVEERLKKGPARLRRKDWKSGDKLWLIDIIAPYGNADKMIEALKDKEFKDKEFKYQKISANGTREIVTVPGT